MVMSCSVPRCKSRKDATTDKSVTFHSFPVDPAVRQLWLDNLGRRQKSDASQPWVPGKSAKVCSKHFAKACFKKKSSKGKKLLQPRLWPKAFPTKELGIANCFLPHRVFSLQSPSSSSSFKEENSDDDDDDPGKDWDNDDLGKDWDNVTLPTATAHLTAAAAPDRSSSSRSRRKSPPAPYTTYSIRPDSPAARRHDDPKRRRGHQRPEPPEPTNSQQTTPIIIYVQSSLCRKCAN